MNAFKRISVYEAEILLEEHINCLLLDCRDAGSYCRDHHNRAIHLSDLNLRNIIKNTPKNVHVIIYCYHGNSSQDFAKLFSDFGFEHTYSVDGGFDAWRKSPDFPTKPLSKPVLNWLNENGFQPSDLNAFNAQDVSPLMLAAKEGREDLIKALVDAGVDPDILDSEGNNALWYACLSHNLRCVTKLIYADIDVSHHNLKGLSPLNYALAAGLEEVISVLVNSGANDSIININPNIAHSDSYVGAQAIAL